MAKMTGPEEFFEVFRSKKSEQQQPPPQTEKRLPQEQPARPQTVMPYGSSTRPMTVTVKVSTLAVAGISAGLLVILAFLIGRATSTGSEPAPGPPRGHEEIARGTGQQPPVGTVNGGEQPPQQSGLETAAPPVASRGRWVVQVATYGDDQRQRDIANSVMQFLQGVPEVGQTGSFVGAVKLGNNHVIWVGPFESRTSQKAQIVLNAVRNAEFRTGTRDFGDAILTNALPIQ